MHGRMSVPVYGVMESPGLVADIMRYHVRITSGETLSRFCGAMSKKVFPSVSPYTWERGSIGAWESSCESMCLCMFQEVDSILKALMQAWDKAQSLEITYATISPSKFNSLPH